LQGIGKFFIRTFVNALHQGHSVVDEVIDPAVVGNDFFGKALQYGFVGNIAGEILVVLLIYNTDGRAVFLKFFGNAFTDALSAASNDGYFMLKHIASPRISVVIIRAPLQGL
jgi:hypothetical protein